MEIPTSLSRVQDPVARDLIRQLINKVNLLEQEKQPIEEVMAMSQLREIELRHRSTFRMVD